LMSMQTREAIIFKLPFRPVGSRVEARQVESPEVQR
jgi:hypothetical protein